MQVPQACVGASDTPGIPQLHRAVIQVAVIKALLFSKPFYIPERSQTSRSFDQGKVLSMSSGRSLRASLGVIAGQACSPARWSHPQQWQSSGQGGRNAAQRRFATPCGPPWPHPLDTLRLHHPPDQHHGFNDPKRQASKLLTSKCCTQSPAAYHP